MYFLLLLIITIPSFVSLLNPWYFSMHDFQHIARLFLLDQGVHQGYLFPRWVDLLGFHFGYPLFNFYPPLIYYISELFRLVGFSYIWSIKSMVISGYLLGAVGMYKLSYKVTSSKVASLVAATLFTFFTYHAVLVYVRGAFAEFFGMNILPFAFLSLELLKDKPTVRHAVFFGTTLALLILSHVFVAFPFILFFAVYVLFSMLYVSKKLKYLAHIALGGLLGAGLSAFFWLPSMLERKFTLVNAILTKELASYSIHFVQPAQLWFSQWGYGGSGAGLADGMSFQLGKIHITLAAFSFTLFLFLLLKKKIETLHATRYTLYAAMLLLSLFMTTEYSRFIWNAVSPLQYLQFPWRFLSFTGVFIAIVGGYVVALLSHAFKGVGQKKWVELTVSFVIICTVIFQYSKYFKPDSYVYKTDKDLTSSQEISWNVSASSFEFSPKGVPLTKSKYRTSIFDIDEKQVSSIKYQVSKKDAAVIQAIGLFNEKVFKIESSEAFVFQLNTFNFPGWTAYIDGGRLPISDDNRYKLITVPVPAGIHNLEFRFEDTPIRRLANTISLVGLVGTILLLGVSKFKKGKA